jgi:hypothetical protein
VCTLVNLLPGDCCEACGAAPWSCGTCTLENEADAQACGACGSQRHGLVEETVERKVSALSGWAQTATLRAAHVARPARPVRLPPEELADAPFPPLQSSGPGRPPSACVACRPRVECVACRTRRRNAALLERERSLLERETQRTTAHIRWESSGLHPLYADEDVEAARLSSVPGDLRAPILEAAAAQPTSVGAVDAASLRRMMEAAEIAQRGGALSAPAEELATSATTAEGRPVRLDTVWAVEGRHPHRRAEALLAAGWQPVMRGAKGGVGSHLKYRRCLVLPDGSAMQAQVLTFSSTPSDCRSWDNEAAKLQRVDREATAEIEMALDRLYVRSLG